MNTQKTVISRRRIFESFVVLICAIVAVGVIYVLANVYEPNLNAIEALGSVCMDVVCIFVLILLSINMTFEKGHINRTTKLFLALMLETMLALFLDFLVWTLDGMLSFNDITFVFIVTSLCSGAVLASIFLFYLGSYMDDMYNLKSAKHRAKIGFYLNLIAFIITITLALTHNAFDIVDGHYRTGSLYDLVTIIPVFTVLYMTGYSIKNVKTIGVHDVVAVAGYILTMVSGAMIEAVFGVGTTYVGITIADIFIFVMLQNKLIDRAERQRKELSEKISSQYEILETMAGIYSYVDFIDLDKKEVSRFNLKDSNERIDHLDDSHTDLNKILVDGFDDEYKEKYWTFTDLSTLSERMKNEKIISAEFHHKEDGWIRAHYIRIGETLGEDVKKVIYAIRNIDEEKKNVEKWIRKSNTDELTGFYNRHAYEEEIAELEKTGLKENFVYISIDVNSLKLANDNLGHDAGDELIIGACECLSQCFGPYGKLYRTGGDEFVALIYADEKHLDRIKKDIQEVTENWKGKLNQNLTMSCGYVTRKEALDKSLHQIAVLADKRMYEDKKKYYQKRGIDRRGQSDAHVALHSLYTKILKVNLTEDFYKIVNMNENEKTEQMGFSDKFSVWVEEFGKSGQVHPDDLKNYLVHTNSEYLKDYFKNNKSDDILESLKIFYRRKNNDHYDSVMMEMIPANDYTDDVQKIFLYVKSL